MAAPCDEKLDYIERLARLAEEHFNITSAMVNDSNLTRKLLPKASKLNEQWAELRKELAQHMQRHGC